MKKLLLILIIILVSFSAFAQDKAPKEYDIKEAQEIVEINRFPGLVTTSEGRRVYFDPKVMQYVNEERIVKKYGRKTVKMLDEWYVSNILNKQIASMQDRSQGILSQNTNKSNLKYDDHNKSYILKVRTENLVIGTSMIGASAAAYMLTNSIIENKLKDEMDVDEIASLSKTKRTVGYVCAGTSLVGVIVVLTGLHKEYGNRVKLAHNLTISDYGAGISLTKKF